MGMLGVALIILVGQVSLLLLLEARSSVQSLCLHWNGTYIIAGTSVVLWIGEIWRGVKRM